MKNLFFLKVIININTSAIDCHDPYVCRNVVPLAGSLACVYALLAKPVLAGVYTLPTNLAFCRYPLGKLVKKMSRL